MKVWKLLETEGINNEQNDTRGEKATQIVSALNLIKQTVPTGIIKGNWRKTSRSNSKLWLPQPQLGDLDEQTVELLAKRAKFDGV